MDGPFRGINVVSISVRDLDRARIFYGRTLGLGEPLYNLPEAGWIEFSTGSESGNLSIVPAAPGWAPSTGTTLVLNVEDCHKAVGELRARGVTCEDPQTFPGFVTFASFYDPDGNRLQMCSPALEEVARQLPRVSVASGGPQKGVDLNDTAALQEADDLEHVGKWSG